MTRHTPTAPSSKNTMIRTIAQIAGAIHRRLYRQTGGRVGYNFRGGHVLLLTTTGRKTGKHRTWPLMYFADGAALIVVGSNGGLDRDPAWCHNLRSNPDAMVEIGREQRRVRAEEVTGAEWNRVWQLVVAQAPFYDQYRTKTARHIPLMRLHSAAE